MNLEELNQIRETALAEARGAADAASLEAVRIKYLGRNGLLPDVMAQLKSVPNEEKPLFGKGANALKNELADLIKERQAVLSTGSKKEDAFDLTLPGLWPSLGSEHPISKVTARIVEIFQSIGFTVADGPDIETVWNNFDALNTPADHPSRDEQDTFYL
ncbi:MAG: hypothetical protein PHP93_09085, partial [Kiritimatiellales bacterium]|nr:hypothetical protein [Kiritimatiellales bacterium]